jgi:stage V sporulation protein D (sporulation-specific penicillin-binding protein)
MNTLYAYGLLFLLLTGFLFVIQVIMGPDIQRSALSQWTRETPIAAGRGEITDAGGRVLATNNDVYKVLVRPRQIAESDRERTAMELSSLLGLDYDYVYERCTSSRYQEIVLKRQVDVVTRNAVNALKLGSGVATVADSKRSYPMGTLFSQVLGFTNIDGEGQAGLELAYNTYLAGTAGKQVVETDASGNPLEGGVTELVDPIEGLELRLSSDSMIQSCLENALSEALEANNAKAAMGIVMDCRTGAILALSSQPDYDPNQPPRSDLEMLAELSRIRIVTDSYEPGSTFKILTLAAAIDSGAASLSSSYFCSGGTNVNGETIHCWRHSGHGSETLIEAAENSCNCAFMKMALTIGKEKFYDYLYAFGLGQSTDSGLPGETGGIVTHEKYVTDNDLARIGFGQSIAVTPIQLCSAVCAAINGGELHTPYIVESMIDADGNVVYRANTEPVRRVISEETSGTVRAILQSVVDNGTGKNCRIAGYRIGGKTGTAQKYDEYGRVDSGRYICSFIGFAPADRPRYVCLIMVDEPQVSSIFGSTVAAPYVRRVFEEILPYAGILPSFQEETVIVPDLVGKSAAKAEKLLEELGLEAIFQSHDKITAQVPAAGEEVPVGFSVLLYTGIDEEPEDGEQQKEYVKIPDLIGKTPLQVYDALSKIGVEMVTETDDPAGECYKTSVSAGTVVAKGFKLKVYFRLPEPTEEDAED